MQLCELCQNDEAYNFHHFIPRTLHSNKWFKRRFTRDAMREGLRLCRDCHRALHAFIPEKELCRNYHSRQKLLTHPQLARFVAWKRRRLKHLRAAFPADPLPQEAVLACMTNN